MASMFLTLSDKHFQSSGQEPSLRAARSLLHGQLTVKKIQEPLIRLSLQLHMTTGRLSSLTTEPRGNAGSEDLEN